MVVPDRLYQLALKRLDAVTFSAPPGKTPYDQGTFAGMAALQIPSSGSYRISVDLPLWIDVAVNGERVPAKDYEGQQSCDAPQNRRIRPRCQKATAAAIQRRDPGQPASWLLRV